MTSPEQSLEEFCHTLAESGKVPTCQPPVFHLKADATLPLGPTTAKFELGIGVEDGRVKPAFQVELEGLPAATLDAATGQKRKPAQRTIKRSRRTPASPSTFTRRGHPRYANQVAPLGTVNRD